ncbi:hypothetical protein LJR234_004626 [Mesorhizobium amorphae]|uniref:hypothetical protein n=1 Tax=Mesorhizobium amorphae TaxID=71433 RepID=UPI003ECF4F9B
MARYIWKDSGFYDRQTGEKMRVRKGPICAPAVMSDIPEYASPIDGKMITSRSQRRDDLKKNNCVEYEPSLSPTKGKFRNPDFCKKRGLQVSEEFR